MEVNISLLFGHSGKIYAPSINAAGGACFHSIRDETDTFQLFGNSKRGRLRYPTSNQLRFAEMHQTA